MFFVFVVNAVVVFAINGVAGCVAAWQLSWLAFWFVFVLVEMLTLAESNAQITGVTDIYHRARNELMQLGIEVASGSGAEAACLAPDRTQALLATITWHATVLDGFQDVGRLKATFLGVAIDYSVIRTAVATVFTLAVGLWGILRGVGISVVFQTFCMAP
ncbi:hypothetical protein DFJ74DRAFT_706586 [Hyaloraphidium curvatum]|nr:hypothetical protein DFJ74DRAFT_706586 [Hyaloraphidium curvatum]